MFTFHGYNYRWIWTGQNDEQIVRYCPCGMMTLGLTPFFIANEKRWQREEKKSLILAGKIKAKNNWVGWTEWELLLLWWSDKKPYFLHPTWGSKGCLVHVLYQSPHRSVIVNIILAQSQIFVCGGLEISPKKRANAKTSCHKNSMARGGCGD